VIRTIEIAMPDLDRDYDPSESREVLLDRKLRMDNVDKPDWIEIIALRKPNRQTCKVSKSDDSKDQF